jgi:hypothetical protein
VNYTQTRIAWIRPRFTLRFLLLTVTALAAVLGYFFDRVNRERGCAAALRKRCVSLAFDHQHRATPRLYRATPISELEMGSAFATPPARHWVERKLGFEYFRGVTAIELGNDCGLIQDILPVLHKMPSLREIFLYQPSPTNVGQWERHQQALTLLRGELPHVQITPYCRNCR